jgi:phage repressor protein C with HTH and peptisase S24 domain
MKKYAEKPFSLALKYIFDLRGHGEQTRIAKIVGKRQSYISALVRGELKGTESTRREISDAMGFPYEDMLKLGEILLKELNEPLDFIEQSQKRILSGQTKPLNVEFKTKWVSEPANKNKPFEPELIKVPVFNSGAGEPSSFTDEGYPIGIASEYVHVAKKGTDKHTFAVRIHGESMLPYLNPGDLVVVVPSMPLENGKLCFSAWYRAAEKKMVKRYFRYGDFVILRSDNPNREKYPDIELDISQPNDVKIYRITQSIRWE